MSFDVFKKSQAYLKKDVFSFMSLKRLKKISRKYWVIFQNSPTKMILSDFCRVIAVSDKIDVGPLETLKK